MSLFQLLRGFVLTGSTTLNIRRQKCDNLFNELNLKSMNDWYSYSTSEIRNTKGGWTVLKKESLFRVLIKLYPEYKWYPWLFKGAFGYWKNMSNHALFLEWITGELEIKSNEDWYLIKKDDFCRYEGWGTLSKYYNNSHFEFLFTLIPSYQWKPWLFVSAPQGYWKDMGNRKFALECFFEEQDMSLLNDWYSVKQSDLVEYSLGGLMRIYNSNIMDLLMDIYPDENWMFWKFDKVGNGKWIDDDCKKEYLNWFEEQVQIKSPDDWYNVKAEDFFNHSGVSLLYSKFGGSPQKVAQFFHPNHEWLPWKFQTSGQGYWNNRLNVEKYLYWLGDKLEINTPDDWYEVTSDDFKKNDGYGIMSAIGGYQKLIMEYIINPQGWKSWLFLKVPNGFWENRDNQIEYMNWLERELGLLSLDDWYDLDGEVLKRRNGHGLLSHYSTSLQYILLELYPNHEWDLNKLYKVGKNQAQLFNIVKKLFPNDEIKSNFRGHKKLRFEGSRMPMELDIWVSSKKLAFEYQGEQHFEAFHRGITQGSSSPRYSLESQQKRDQEKRKACKDNEICLVEIDYKWERTEEFVAQKIIDAGFKGLCSNPCIQN